MAKPGKFGFHPETFFALLTAASTGFVGEATNRILYTDAGIIGWVSWFITVSVCSILLQTTIDYFIESRK